MIDKHHILHDRVSWEARPQSKLLRSTPSLVPALDRDVHNEIHANCPPVPTLGYHALTRVLREFQPSANTLDTVDDLMFSINEASKHPKAHDIERQLCQLAIQAIDLQRPILKSGIVVQHRRIVA